MLERDQEPTGQQHSIGGSEEPEPYQRQHEERLGGATLGLGTVVVDSVTYRGQDLLQETLLGPSSLVQTGSGV